MFLQALIYFFLYRFLSFCLSLLSISLPAVFLSFIPLSCLYLHSISPSDGLLCNSQVMGWPVERPLSPTVLTDTASAPACNCWSLSHLQMIVKDNRCLSHLFCQFVISMSFLLPQLQTCVILTKKDTPVL